MYKGIKDKFDIRSEIKTDINEMDKLVLFLHLCVVEQCYNAIITPHMKASISYLSTMLK